MAYVTAEHLKYKYPGGKGLALDNISFSVERGEFIGIIGKNGSGKSSLCQAIAGLIPHFYKGAYGGRLLLGNMEVRRADWDALCGRVGIVFQNPFNQVTGAMLTVYEVFASGLENLGVPREEMRRRIDGAMELLHISGLKDRYPFDLSGGQMQRMAIAGVLAMRPDIMVLDEPVSQLDPQGRREVFEAVRELSRQGITIFMAEHNMEQIADFSDRVMLLYEGRLAAFDTPEKLFSRADISDYEVELPVFTRVARDLGLRDEDGAYPVTLSSVKKLFWESRKAAERESLPEGVDRDTAERKNLPEGVKSAEKEKLPEREKSKERTGKAGMGAEQ